MSNEIVIVITAIIMVGTLLFMGRKNLNNLTELPPEGSIERKRKVTVSYVMLAFGALVLLYVLFNGGSFNLRLFILLAIVFLLVSVYLVIKNYVKKK